MTCIARVRQHSLIWRTWREAAKPGGVLAGVAFQWEPGNVYRSGALSREQAAVLRLHPDVELEMTGDEPPVDNGAVEPGQEAAAAAEIERPKWQPPRPVLRPWPGANTVDG